MGPSGAAAIAILAFSVLVVALALLGTALWAGRGGGNRSAGLRAARNLAFGQLGLVGVGLVLSKRTLRAIAFPSAARWLTVTASLVGVALAIRAIARREPGGIRWLVTHLFLATVCALPTGEWLFGIFLLM